MKSITHDIKNTLKSIIWNWRVLLIFEFLYKILGGLILFPILHIFVNFTLKRAKTPYLDLETLSTWLLHPFTIPVLIFCLLILGVYIMLEMSVMVQYFYSSNHKEKLSLCQLLKISINKSLHAARPQNWLLLFFVMILFPITSFTLTPDTLINLRIPEYVVDYFRESGGIYIIYTLIVVIVNFIVFYMIYSIPIFILEDVSFLTACKKSYGMMKNKFFKTLFKYLSWIIAILLIFLLICGIFLLFSIIKFRYIDYNDFSEQNFLINYIQLKQYATFIFRIVIFSGSFAFIMNNYLHHIGYNIDFKKVEKKKPRVSVVVLSIAELLLMFTAIGFYIDYHGNAFEMFSLISQKRDIVAHRAGSLFAPENTLPALEKAIKSNADYAEIDIQQSKDKELIILHDTNFKRTTGVNKNVWDVTYDEIKTYDAGSYYSPEFENTRIPTLEQMIQKANGKIKLMIELKINGHESNLEEDTINLIKKYNFENQCVIASMNLEVLHKIKELDKNIKTVYITPIIFGEYYGMKDVDMFSIESTFIDRNVIFRIHSNDKKVFVWTINEDEAMKKLLSLPIDGIVTDNPELAAYYRSEGGSDPFISALMEVLFPDY